MARIAIDAMGLDNGSKTVVASVKKYKMEHPDTIFYVCGREEELVEKMLENYNSELITTIYSIEGITI